MEATQAVFSCIFALQCAQLGADAVNGGNILLAVAGTALAMTVPVVRKHVAALLTGHWQVALMVMIGAAFFFYDQRSVPFVICLVTAAAFVVLRWSAVESRLAKTLNRMFARVTLPRMRLSSYALTVGIIAYAAAQIGQFAWESRRSDVLAKNEAKVLVAFTLPSRNSSLFANVKHKDLVGDLEKELFDSTRNTLRDIFSHVGKKIEILPASSANQPFERLRDEFSAKPDRRTILAAKLAAHRRGVGSPVDLAVGTVFTLISVERRRIDFVFRLYRLKRPAEADRPPQLNSASWPQVRIDASDDDIYQTALVAGARLAMMLAKESSNLSGNDKKILWKNLNGKFREYYNDIDNRIADRGEDWPGHKVFDDEACSGRQCVQRWLSAYAQEQSDNDGNATERLEAERRKAVTPLATIAQAGRGSK